MANGPKLPLRAKIPDLIDCLASNKAFSQRLHDTVAPGPLLAAAVINSAAGNKIRDRFTSALWCSMRCSENHRAHARAASPRSVELLGITGVRSMIEHREPNTVIRVLDSIRDSLEN